jgi:hypothetical protein
LQIQLPSWATSLLAASSFLVLEHRDAREPSMEPLASTATTLAYTDDRAVLATEPAWVPAPLYYSARRQANMRRLQQSIALGPGALFLGISAQFLPSAAAGVSTVLTLNLTATDYVMSYPAPNQTVLIAFPVVDGACSVNTRCVCVEWMVG